MEDPVKILIVDDEQSVLNIMERLFIYENYEVMTASSAAEGLAILEKESPVQLVISDYRMPVMTGVEFLEEVYKKWPDTVRIILSGYADLDAVISAINRGQIYKFISKPWNNSDLKVTVGNALERYYLHKKNVQLTETLLQKNEELQRFNENLEQLVSERTAELLNTQELLIQSEKLAAIGILAAGIAHEIKNPLAIIIQGTDYLNTVMKDEMLLDIANRLQQAALRADAIIKGLLSYTRQKSLSIEEADIRTLIDETLLFTEHELNRKNIRMIKEYQQELPQVSIDANQIKQVFVNILINAIDATGENGNITIRTDLMENGAGKKMLQVIFTDTGHGIPEEKLQKIFDPFFTTKDIGNTGLGLSISKGIIDKHGGTIHAESRVGEGTSVIIRLPVS